MKIMNRNKEDKDLPSDGRVGWFASTRMTGLYTRTEILRGGAVLIPKHKKENEGENV